VHYSRPPFVLPPSERRPPRVPSHAVNDPVEPAGKRSLFAKGRCLTRQEKERGLEGILCVLKVEQHTAADCEHHRPVPSHNRCESCLIVFSHKRVEEFPVAWA